MLIGLHGEAGSGKDTAYGFIANATPPEVPVRRDAFADRLKVSAARALGYPDPDSEKCIALCNALKVNGEIIVFVEGDTAEERDHWVITGREYLQLYGTEAHRDVFDQDFWVNQVLDHYRKGELLVVTDVRFPNEAEAILAAGGTIWEIVRPNAAKIAESGHASETRLPDDLIDLTIVNDGTLEEFREEVLDALTAEEAIA